MDIATSKDPLLNRRSPQEDASQDRDDGHDSSNTKSAGASDSNDQNPYTTSKPADRSSMCSSSQGPYASLDRPPVGARRDSSARFAERITADYSLPQPSYRLHNAEADDQYPNPTIDLGKSSEIHSQAQPSQVYIYAPSIGPPAPCYPPNSTPHVESSTDAEEPRMKASLNNYFVPGYGISRVIIQGKVRDHYGPDAIIRPFTHQGRDGFLITTAGPPLTKAQIEDIKEASREYEERCDRSYDQEQYLIAMTQSPQLPSRQSSVAGADRVIYPRNTALIQPSRSDRPRDSESERTRRNTMYNTDFSRLKFDPTFRRDTSTNDRRIEKIHSDVNKVEAYLAGMNGNYSSVVDGLRTNTGPFANRGNIRKGRRETDTEGPLVQPQISNVPVYECPFNFLGCRFMASDENDWRLHNLSHFHGNVPPRSIKCPFCDSGFDADDGHAAWEAWMSHLAAHFRTGEKLATSRQDFKLFLYLWQNRIIDDAAYKELISRGTLCVRQVDPYPSSTVDAPGFEGRRRRMPLYHRDGTYVDGGFTPLPHSQTADQREPPLQTRTGIRPSRKLPVVVQKSISRHTRTSVSRQGVREGSVGTTADPGPTKFFSLETELIEFVAEELQEVEDLLEVIVVTGTEDRAFAASCANYAEKIWPELGKPALHSLIKALKPLEVFRSTHDHQELRTLEERNIGRGLLVSASLVRDPASKCHLRIDFEVQGKPKEVSELSEIFRWLSTVCRKPVPDELLCSQTREAFRGSRRTQFTPEPLKTSLGTGGSGCCWHDMFKGYVLAEGFPIPDRGSQRGVELPFDVMTLLSLVLYPINFGRGIVLKGDNTALIPSTYEDAEDCVQWHYLEGDGAGGPLTWDRIKEHCQNIYPSKDFKELQSKRTFVGYFSSVKIHLGTRDSGFDKVDFSGAEYDDKRAFVLGNELVGQVGTSVMNVFTMNVSGKVKVHGTAQQRLLGVHDSIMDKIRNSKDFPMLLFDVKTKQGWLVPELSAVLHMALAWASYQHQSAEVLSNMPFAEARPDGGVAAYDAILRSADLLLPNHIKVGVNSNTQVSVRQALMMFLARIGQIKDQQLQRYACGLKESKHLVGYEFKEVASFEERLHLRRSKVDVDKSGGWLRLVSCKPEMAVVLCSHLEAPIQPASTQPTCPFWQTVPTDQYYLTASISCLRQLAKRCGGEETLRLYNDIYCTLPKNDPGPGVCGTRKWPCCNPLLEISKHPSKKVLRFDNDGALIIGKAVPHTEDKSSLRVFWKFLSSGKNDKAQNGNFSVIQSNHQILTGTVTPPLPRNSGSSEMP